MIPPFKGIIYDNIFADYLLFYFWLHWVFTAAWELSLVAARGLLLGVASLVAEHGLQGVWASAVVLHGLSCPAARGIFPDEGSNLCPLQCQVDS